LLSAVGPHEGGEGTAGRGLDDVMSGLEPFPNSVTVYARATAKSITFPRRHQLFFE
jgi:hypothetical protein